MELPSSMARKNESPQKAAMRKMMSVLLEGVLDEELDGELGYSKYDYRNKDTDNSRNGHSTKTITCQGGKMVSVNKGSWDKLSESGNIDGYLKHIEDVKPMTARQCINCCL